LYNPVWDRSRSFVASLLCGLAVALLCLEVVANSQDDHLRDAMQKYIMAFSEDSAPGAK
jgi:hypothetical protein